MARGWESKSVEAQIEESNIPPSSNESQIFSPAELQARLKKSDLLLSRKRVLQQLENGGNERYCELLRRTLASLEAQIAALC
jgi:hypothetical protein